MQSGNRSLQTIKIEYWKVRKHEPTSLSGEVHLIFDDPVTFFLFKSTFRLTKNAKISIRK